MCQSIGKCPHNFIVFLRIYSSINEQLMATIGELFKKGDFLVTYSHFLLYNRHNSITVCGNTTRVSL